MNAPASFRQPTWQDFRSTVLPLFRRAGNDEIELRARLLLIRDRVIVAMGYSTAEAYHLLRAISEMAGRYALEDGLTIAQLTELRRILILASTSASSMQVLMNDIHHAAEAENARG